MTHSKGNNVTKSVSLPPDIADFADDRAAKLRIPLSKLMQMLLVQDMATRKDIVISERPNPDQK